MGSYVLYLCMCYISSGSTYDISIFILLIGPFEINQIIYNVQNRNQSCDANIGINHFHRYFPMQIVTVIFNFQSVIV